MGNSESQHSNFPLQKYQRYGLTNDEILGLREVFLSFDPEDGIIEVKQFKKLYHNSYDKDAIDRQVGSRKQLNFDEFFEIMQKSMMDKKQKYGNVEFDSHPQDAQFQCMLCTTVDKK